MIPVRGHSLTADSRIRISVELGTKNTDNENAMATLVYVLFWTRRANKFELWCTSRLHVELTIAIVTMQLKPGFASELLHQQSGIRFRKCQEIHRLATRHTKRRHNSDLQISLVADIRKQDETASFETRFNESCRQQKFTTSESSNYTAFGKLGKISVDKC